MGNESIYAENNRVGEVVGFTLNGATPFPGGRGHFDFVVQIRIDKAQLAQAFEPIGIRLSLFGRNTATRGSIEVGYVPAGDGQLLRFVGQPDHAWDAHFPLELDTFAVAAIDELRQGGDLKMQGRLDVRVCGEQTTAARGQATLRDFIVPASEWQQAVMNARLREYVATELPLDRDVTDVLRVSLDFLRAAERKRRDGARSDDILTECRKSLEALKPAGFGGRAPDDVARWMTTGARAMTIEERAAVLRVALHLFMHPGAHADDPRYTLTRADADFAVAATAALLRLAPVRLWSPALAPEAEATSQYAPQT